MCTHNHTVVALFSLLSHNHIIKKLAVSATLFSHLLSPSYIFTILSHSYNFLTTFLSHFLYNHIHVMIEIELSSSQRTTRKLRKKSHMGYLCESMDALPYCVHMKNKHNLLQNYTKLSVN
jgi:hypothetical protein